MANINSSKDEKEILKNADKYAKSAGIKLNPERERAEITARGLMKNKRENGACYCPCRIVTGNKKKDEEIICPCVFHRGEIELEGHCRCLLFFAKEIKK